MASAAGTSGAANSGEKDFDVVVWGATGFVGKLVCERLARKYQGKVKWAMAGRNRERLEAVRDTCAAANGVAKDTEILIGDIEDQASLAAIARRTKVVIAMAGPYAKFGEPIVEACLAEGTHYVDITGEPWYIRKLMDRYHEAAAVKNIRIVPTCGYDSIPSDIGTFFLAQHAREKLNKEVTDVRMLIAGGKGGISGGTIDSLLNPNLSREERRLAQQPYCLNPPGMQGGRDGRDQVGVGWIPELGKRTFPFIMQPINSRVVRRSNALYGERYGKGMTYNESCIAPGPSIITAPLVVGVLGLSFGALISPIGPFLRRKLLPAAGQGPSQEMMETGSWKHIYLATLAGEKEATLQAIGQGEGDPGYGSTHRMILEAALCLALEMDECEAAGCLKGGILTPATAMGPVLLNRLQQYGDVKFSISTCVGARDTMTPEAPVPSTTDGQQQSKM